LGYYKGGRAGNDSISLRGGRVSIHRGKKGMMTRVLGKGNSSKKGYSWKKGTTIFWITGWELCHNECGKRRTSGGGLPKGKKRKKSDFGVADHRTHSEPEGGKHNATIKKKEEFMREERKGPVSLRKTFHACEGGRTPRTGGGRTLATWGKITIFFNSASQKR